MQTNLKSLQDKIKDLETKLSKVNNNDDSSVVIEDDDKISSKNLTSSKGILKRDYEEPSSTRNESRMSKNNSRSLVKSFSR